MTHTIQNQVFRVSLKIIQQCEENMDSDEMKEWVEKHFVGCDYGKVEVTIDRTNPKNISLVKEQDNDKSQ